MKIQLNYRELEEGKQPLLPRPENASGFANDICFIRDTITEMVLEKATKKQMQDKLFMLNIKMHGLMDGLNTIEDIS